MQFFAYTQDDQPSIGIDLPEGRFDFNQALAIYQKAEGNKQPVSVPFLQVLVETGLCSAEAATQVMGNPWVKSKMGSLKLPASVRVDVPIGRPGKILGLGRNYKAHAQELDHAVPETPIFFAKPPSALIADGDPIRIPTWIDGRVDHEAELGLVIGQVGRDIPEADALSYVAGYTIVNDVTARDLQKIDVAAGLPWFRSKGLDTFCPMGPGITPADAVADPQNLDITLTVNGQARQSANTREMIFSVKRIIAELSRFMTLHPGDIIATGTPQGVGPIQAGDEIEITITGLGSLRNTVI